MAGRPKLDLHQKIREILFHTGPLSPESDSPIKHYESSANASFLMIDYVEDHIDIDTIYKGVLTRHISNLHRLVLGNLIEIFERFLKEIAAVEGRSLAALIAEIDTARGDINLSAALRLHALAHYRGRTSREAAGGVNTATKT